MGIAEFVRRCLIWREFYSNMSLLDVTQQYEIERQTVRTLLDGALRTRGDEIRLARAAELSPVHLSYIRADKRMPSVAMARRLAAELSWTGEQRDGFVHHVERMWQLKVSCRREVSPRSPGPSDEMLQLVRQAHAEATFARDSSNANILYRRARMLSELFLDVTNPQQAPLKFLEFSFVAHDALCVLNRSDEALWHAKRARVIALSLERAKTSDRERTDFARVNALRCEAVALHNLGLARSVQEVCQEIETVEGLKQSEGFWRPWLNRDKMQALMERPRFSIREIESLAWQGIRVCEKRRDPVDPLVVLLLTQSLARAYLINGNFQKAFRLLSRMESNLEQIPQIGPLHRVMFFKTFAQYYWLQGSRGAEWRSFAGRAWRLASDAGLDHQRQELEKEFGTALVGSE